MRVGVRHKREKIEECGEGERGEDGSKYRCRECEEISLSATGKLICVSLHIPMCVACRCVSLFNCSSYPSLPPQTFTGCRLVCSWVV